MSLFPWALIFVGLALLSLGVLALVGLRLWRAAKALISGATQAHETLLQVWSGSSASDQD